MNARMIVFIVCKLVIVLMLTSSCTHKLVTWQNTEHLQRKQLSSDSLFTYDVYKNFKDASFADNRLTFQLATVARYNEIVSKIDTAYTVKIKFSFKGMKTIRRAAFYYLGEEIELFVENEEWMIDLGLLEGKDGLVIFYNPVGKFEYKDYYKCLDYSIEAGVWKNQHKVGVHISYDPSDSLFCYKKEFYDSVGNLLNEKIVEHCDF